MGLLLLRATVGATALVQGAICLGAGSNSAFGTGVVGLLALASGVALLFGFLTPVAGTIVAVGSVSFALSWVPVPTPHLLDSFLATAFIVIMATTIGLLGPGAFSLDARLFGRREIIIPPAPRSPKT